jgi:4-aminobutyrate aminotransferase
VVTLDAVRKEALAENAQRQGSVPIEGLRAMADFHPLIGDIRGHGLILGVELVLDRNTKEPATKECAKLVLRCCQLGLLLHCVGLFPKMLWRLSRYVVEITPPLVLTGKEATQGVRRGVLGLPWIRITTEWNMRVRSRHPQESGVDDGQGLVRAVRRSG